MEPVLQWFYSILLINTFVCVNSAAIPRQLRDASKILMKIQNTVSICRIASLFLMTFTLDNMSSWMYFLLHCLLLTPGLSNMEKIMPRRIEPHLKTVIEQDAGVCQKEGRCASIGVNSEVLIGRQIQPVFTPSLSQSLSQSLYQSYLDLGNAVTLAVYSLVLGSLTWVTIEIVTNTDMLCTTNFVNC